MSSKVRLEDVTARNWRAVARLKLAPEQEHLVASNLYSIAQWKFDRNAHPRAIYAADTPVGFLMYSVREAGDKTREASIYRFMIDREHQRKGYGRAALTLVLGEIKALPGIKTISIGYMPDNSVAKPFYASFGFAEVGTDDDGEIIAELKL